MPRVKRGKSLDAAPARSFSEALSAAHSDDDSGMEEDDTQEMPKGKPKGKLQGKLQGQLKSKAAAATSTSIMQTAAALAAPVPPTPAASAELVAKRQSLLRGMQVHLTGFDKDAQGPLSLKDFCKLVADCGGCVRRRGNEWR
jgi:hypothetical protein